MDSLTVACVYKPSSEFTPDYVYRLRDGVELYCPRPYTFVVLTDEKLPGCETVSLSRDLPGWWNKLDLFRPGLFSGRVAYFDLDTMIVGDLTKLLSAKHEFSVLRDFYGKHRIGSGAMVWDADKDWSHLYSRFRKERIPEYSKSMDKWGDQGWIADHLGIEPDRLQDKCPGQIVSYKVDVQKQRQVPDDAAVVCFHGKPRPHHIGWVLPGVTS